MMSNSPVSYFELFGLPQSFAVSHEALQEKYRALQQSMHPDRFATAPDQERRAAMERAAEVNQAYQVLKDPLARARYLLGLHGIEWDDEQDTVMDPEFLMEQIERREALSEVRERADPLTAVGLIVNDVLAGIRRMTEELGGYLADPDSAALEQAKILVRRLQFLYRLREEAESLEADLEDGL